MPRLNSQGAALMGVAGHPCSIDGELLPHTLLIGQWLRDRVVVAAGPNGGVYSWDRDGGNLLLLDTRGANELIAGGGRWQGWNPTGAFGSLGDKPGEGLRGGSPAALALVPNYASGFGFVTFATPPDTGGIENASAAAQDLQCPTAEQVYWWDLAAHTILRTPTVPPFRPAFPPRRLRWVPSNSGDWLVYFAEGHGTYAQLNGATDGWLLETEDAFGLDAVAIPNGLMVAWSTAPGEDPGDLVKLLVTPHNIFDLIGSAPRAQYLPILNPPPPDPIPTPIPPDPIPVPPKPTPVPPKPTPRPDSTLLVPYTGASMTPKKVGLIGPGGFYGRLDAKELGQGPFGGYPTHWDRTTVGADETFTLTEQPDGHFTLVHDLTGRYFGADATEQIKDICGQYTSHATSPGGYELWTVKRVRAGDTIIAFIEYDRPGHPRYTSQSLTVIEQ